MTSSQTGAVVPWRRICYPEPSDFSLFLFRHAGETGSPPEIIMASRTVSLSAVVQSGRAADSAASATGPDQALHVAEALQYLGPFPAYACLLLNPGSLHLAVLDDTGSVRKDWDEDVRDSLRGCSLEDDVGATSSLPAPA